MADITTKPSLVARRYESCDEVGVRSTLAATFGLNTPTTRPMHAALFWRWKHVDNPFGESYGTVAVDESQNVIAGVRMMMRWTFNLDADAVVAARAVDTATHPNYQRRGIFTLLTTNALADLANTGHGFIFNTPNANSLPGYVKMGWRVVTRLPLHVRIERPLSMLRSVTRMKHAQPGADAHQPVWSDGPVPDGWLSWNEFEAKFGKDIDATVRASEEGRDATRLRTPRSREYLSWRYGKHPYINYLVSPRFSNGRLSGFIVLRRNLRSNLREAVLVEAFAGNRSTSDLVGLMRCALPSVGADYVVAHFARGTLERRALHRARFIQVPRRGVTFTVRSLDDHHERRATSPTSWDLSLGDVEIF